MGGVLAEIYQDASLRLAPVTIEEAHEMIEEVSGLAIIRGYRRMPKGDIRGLASAVVAMSQLALVDNPQVAEAEVNPIIVKQDAVIGVDGLVILAQ